MNLEDIKKIAELARISVPDDELREMAKDLDSIIGFVDQIKSKNAFLEDKKPESFNVFREDRIDPVSSSYDLVSASPSNQDGFIKVPKIID